MKLTIGVLLTFPLLVNCLGCNSSSPPTPAVSSKLAPEEKQALQASLARLEDVLREETPFVHTTLGAPATQEDLNQLSSELDGQRVECLEVWYRWHNGSELRDTQLLPLGRMLSIEEAVEDRRLERGIPLIDSMRKSAFKILDDGAGDGFFVNVASAQPRVFYHMLEDGYPQDFGALEDFVGFIADVHKAGLASRNDKGLVVFDLKRYQEMEQEYLRRLAER